MSLELLFFLWLSIFIILVGLFIVSFINNSMKYLFNYLIYLFLASYINLLTKLIELFFPFYCYHNYGYKRFATTSQYYIGPFYTGSLSFLLFYKKPVKRIFPKKNFQRAFFVLFCVMSYLYLCLVFCNYI
jgi:hypothetical protein